jgi:hypothetical protein
MKLNGPHSKTRMIQKQRSGPSGCQFSSAVRRKSGRGAETSALHLWGYNGGRSMVPDPMPLFREVLLILQAGRLVAAAQPVRQGQAVPRVLNTMCGLRGLPSSVVATTGHRAVERAAVLLGRLGLVNTCLIRSLSLAALLADHPEVQLHLGFRLSDSPGTVLAGHAWVTLGGRALPDETATLVEGRPCEEVAVLTATRAETPPSSPVAS